MECDERISNGYSSERGGQELFSDGNGDVAKWCHATETSIYAAGGHNVKFVIPRPTDFYFQFG